MIFRLSDTSRLDFIQLVFKKVLNLIKKETISSEKMRNSGYYKYNYVHSFFRKDFQSKPRYTGIYLGLVYIYHTLVYSIRIHQYIIIPWVYSIPIYIHQCIIISWHKKSRIHTAAKYRRSIPYTGIDCLRDWRFSAIMRAP